MTDIRAIGREILRLRRLHVSLNEFDANGTRKKYKWPPTNRCETCLNWEPDFKGSEIVNGFYNFDNGFVDPDNGKCLLLAVLKLRENKMPGQCDYRNRRWSDTCSDYE
jgi:hypothetical protein